MKETRASQHSSPSLRVKANTITGSHWLKRAKRHRSLRLPDWRPLSNTAYGSPCMQLSLVHLAAFIVHRPSRIYLASADCAYLLHRSVLSLSGMSCM
ncbi:hypothetical protein BJX66DRAFT_98247 [Aspergillus keveii]|uniref:Uncharacterized protein n=1 Tax=Aspergillus keveii TaxID=714993 RepID=A0ABR4GNR0_9EURO